MKKRGRAVYAGLVAGLMSASMTLLNLCVSTQALNLRGRRARARRGVLLQVRRR